MGRYASGRRGLSRRFFTASGMGTSRMFRTASWRAASDCISANSCSMHSSISRGICNGGIVSNREIRRPLSRPNDETPS